MGARAPQTSQEPQEKMEAETQTEDCNYSCWGVNLLIAGGALVLISVPMAYFAYKLLYANKKKDNTPAGATYKESVEASSMEEGKAVDQEKPAEDDNTSTLAPSSDKQSEPSLNGDVEDDKKSDLSVLKALSDQNI